MTHRDDPPPPAGVGAAAAAFDEATRTPARAQAACLERLLARDRDTAFARDHGLAASMTPREFRRRVPVRAYEELRDYVARAIAGEARVLTHEPPLRFTSTSGTTAEKKLLPVTRSFRHELATLTTIWLERAHRDHPHLFDQSILALVGSDREGATERGAPIGSATGLALRDAPPFLRDRFAVPARLHAIADHDTRFRRYARCAARRRISSIATPNPTTLLRLAETIDEESDAIFRALHHRKETARAHALERLRAAEGRLLPRHLWPDLQLIGCWLGGSVGVHARRLAPLYGAEVPLRDLGFRASEGVFTVPWSDATAAGVLAIDTTFFEFVPEESSDRRTAATLLAHELVAGRRYHVLITTSAGLWRYDLGDLVEVRGFHHRTPLVAFLRKNDEFTSICGEKLHVNHVVAAFGRAQERGALPLRQLRVISDVEGSRYDLLVEFEGAAPDQGRLREWAARFDASLIRDNVEYEARRRSRRLQAPRLHVMRAGWSHAIQHDDVQQGRREAQYKWKLLAAQWDRISANGVVRSLDPLGAVARANR